MSEHTPTPWTASNQYLYGGPLESPLPIASGKKEWATDSGGSCHEEAVANAVFVVKAVNSHDALVKALTEIDTLATCTGVVDPKQHEHMLSNIYRIARAALASMKEAV